MWGTMQSPVARNEDRSNKCCDNSSSELSRATHPHKNSQYVHSRVFQRNRSNSVVDWNAFQSDRTDIVGKVQSQSEHLKMNAWMRMSLSAIRFASNRDCN